MNDKIHVFFFPLFLQPSFMFFLKFLLLMFIFILHLVFIVYFCLLDGFLPCPAFFLVSLPFFSLFSFTAYPFLINCSLFARDFKQLFYNSFIHLSISLLPQIHENLIIDMKRAILLATFMLVLHQTKGNTFISSLLILIKKL